MQVVSPQHVNNVHTLAEDLHAAANRLKAQAAAAGGINLQQWMDTLGPILIQLLQGFLTHTRGPGSP